MLQSASCFKQSARKCLCQRPVTSVTSMKNKSFGARGGYLRVTLFKRNTTQDFFCARSRYLLLTSMDKQSFGARGRYLLLTSMDKQFFRARGRYLNLASKGNVLHMRYLLLARNLTPISEIPFFNISFCSKFDIPASGIKVLNYGIKTTQKSCIMEDHHMSMTTLAFWQLCGASFGNSD